MQGFQTVVIAPINLDPAPVLPNFTGVGAKLKRLIYKYRHRKKRRKTALAALKTEEFSETIKELNPDLLILDVELHAYIICAHAKGFPLLLLSQWFSLWQRKGLPPLLHDTIPGRGESGKPEAIEAAWKKIKKERRFTFLKQKLRSAGTDRRSVLKHYAAEVGFPEEYIRDNFWPGPFTYGGLPVLNMVPRELEFPHEQRPNSYYGGPMVYADRKEAKTTEKIEQRLAVIFADKEKNNKRLIYCSVSTFKRGDAVFLQKICEAARGQSDLIFVLGLGGKIDAKSLEPLPTNVHAFSWIPQLEVLKKADVSLNHGGIHTINECLHFEVPMLIYSGKKSDQNGCAARIHYHGLGMMADKDKDSPDDILRKIRRVAEDPKYKEQTVKFAAICRNYKTEKTAENIIARYIKI